jgi:Domain of unknown function (DUF4386)
VDSSRKAALVAGVLFVIADVAGIPSLALSKPLLDAPDYLIKLSANANQVTRAALLVFIMAAACAGIAISMYPVLREFNVGLALGAVGFRIIEAVFEMVAFISMLLLLALSQEFVKAGAPDSSYFQTLGALLLAGRDWVSNVVMLVNWCLGALMYLYIFYQSKLVPRWLSGWGLVVYPLIIVACTLAMFRLINPVGTIWGVLVYPAGLQELVLAVWLIVKGFNPSAVASLPARQAQTKIIEVPA